jgi:uncharacterized phage protein (TIGR01671 family)
MKRKMKFRAWDKDCKQMFSQDENGEFYPTHQPERGTGYELGDAMKIGLGYSHHKHLVLMQFTGLKDGNGKEVYEGDLLKYDGGQLIVEIKWADGGFYCFKNNQQTIPLAFRLKEQIAEYKIIGNIYENSELLNNN